MESSRDDECHDDLSHENRKKMTKRVISIKDSIWSVNASVICYTIIFRPVSQHWCQCIIDFAPRHLVSSDWRRTRFALHVTGTWNQQEPCFPQKSRAFDDVWWCRGRLAGMSFWIFSCFFLSIRGNSQTQKKIFLLFLGEILIFGMPVEIPKTMVVAAKILSIRLISKSAIDQPFFFSVDEKKSTNQLAKIW